MHEGAVSLQCEYPNILGNFTTPEMAMRDSPRNDPEELGDSLGRGSFGGYHFPGVSGSGAKTLITSY